MSNDFNPDVLTGLAWFYVLASALNAAAAARVAFVEMVSEGASRDGLAPSTRRLPEWIVAAFLGLYAVAMLLIPARHALPRAMEGAYALCAVANILAAIVAGAGALRHARSKGEPTLDDHIPAVGLGGPINRTLWTWVWSLAAIGFQAMGLVYFYGETIALPQSVRDAADYAAGPTTFFAGSTLLFVLMLWGRRIAATGTFGWGLVNLTLLFFGLSMTDADFREIVTKPDNVPIVGLMVLVGFFTWLSLRRAVINDARQKAGMPVLEELQPEKVLTWPDLVYTELICMVGVTIVLVVWAVALQAPLEQPASSTVAPNPSKAPWYFLGLQEMLVYFDPWLAGVVLPSLIVFGLMAMPYIDKNPEGVGYYTIERRKFAYIAFQFGFLVLWLVLILLGTFLRGPNWNFFGPYEYWDPHKLIPLNNVNLSDIFWVQIMGRAKPDSILLREAPGILLTSLYFLMAPVLLWRLFFRKYVEKAGAIRYLILATLILFMAALPIKMILRWTLNLKYVIAIPEKFFNI